MSTRRTFTLPSVGERSSDAEIVAWHVNVGDRVVAGQPLVAVATGDAIVELPAPFGGTIAALHGEPGDRVAVGAALVELGGPGEDHGSLVGRIERAQ